MISWWNSFALWKKIFICLCLGLVVGLLFKDVALILKPIGTLFINLIKMLMVPLVFVTLVTGITSMKDLNKMGRVGLKAFSISLITTTIAVAIGLAFGIIFKPGSGVSLENTAPITTKQAPPFFDTLVSFITTNPVESLAKGEIIQIIFFAIFLGISITLAGEKGKPVAEFFESFSEIMFKMTGIVISFAPIGVFGLIAWVSASYGVDVLLSLGKVIVCVYLACLMHMFITMGGGIALFARLNPIKFFKGIFTAQTVAFTTTSSSGTLPVTTSNAVNNLGVSKAIASFVLPLNASINMDGTAIYQGICVMFVAQAFGVDLSFANYMTIIITATIASVGTAGVPGAGIIMLSMVLASVNLPLEGIAIIAGIDRILDMARTTVNVTGDAMTAVVVAKSEGELDETIYNQANKE